MHASPIDGAGWLNLSATPGAGWQRGAGWLR